MNELINDEVNKRCIYPQFSPCMGSVTIYIGSATATTSSSQAPAPRAFRN